MGVLIPRIIFIMENRGLRHLPSSSEKGVSESVFELWSQEGLSPNSSSFNLVLVSLFNDFEHQLFI